MSEVKKESFEINGKTVMVPQPDEKQIPLKMARLVRGIKNQEQKDQEMFFLLLEHFLTEEELDVWDNLTSEETEQLMLENSKGDEAVK